jgi:hypothetical protein
MHEIKDILMGEIHKVKGELKKSNGGKISRSDMEWLKDLTEVVKNIDKIEILEGSEGYSEESNWMADGRMYGTSYDDGMSYARGRGRNAKRDSMGRYSRDMMHHDDMSYERGASYARGGRGGRRGDYSRTDAKEEMIERLEGMMHDAETSKEREAIKRCIMQIEND